MSTFESVDEIEEPVEILDAPNGSNGDAGSVLDAIRARRATIAAQHEYEMRLPRYGDQLVLVCKPAPASWLTRIRERMQSKNPERDYAVSADLLISVCIAVRGRRKPGGPLTDLDPDEPVRIDDRLAELLGFQAETARDVVRGLFHGAPSPEVAVVSAVNDYMEWSQGASDESDEELLGER